MRVLKKCDLFQYILYIPSKSDTQYNGNRERKKHGQRTRGHADPDRMTLTLPVADTLPWMPPCGIGLPVTQALALMSPNPAMIYKWMVKHAVMQRIYDTHPASSRHPTMDASLWDRFSSDTSSGIDVTIPCNDIQKSETPDCHNSYLNKYCVNVVFFFYNHQVSKLREILCWATFQQFPKICFIVYCFTMKFESLFLYQECHGKIHIKIFTVHIHRKNN